MSPRESETHYRGAMREGGVGEVQKIEVTPNVWV